MVSHNHTLSMLLYTKLDDFRRFCRKKKRNKKEEDKKKTQTKYKR